VLFRSNVISTTLDLQKLPPLSPQDYLVFQSSFLRVLPFALHINSVFSLPDVNNLEVIIIIIIIIIIAPLSILSEDEYKACQAAITVMTEAYSQILA